MNLGLSDVSVMDCEEFLAQQGTIIDVRSPCEFRKGHIPGSYSLPLFEDEERAIIGTIYKQRGRDAAITSGLQVVGPKLSSFSQKIREVVEEGSLCRVLCFRGGMRSQSMQWLCQFIGVPTVRLSGGYKKFRHTVLQTFEQSFRVIVLGGATGSGKTSLLQDLRQRGEQVIDLEALAHHRGSAFGTYMTGEQPTTEQFENILASALLGMDRSSPIFLEDESRSIGRCMIPASWYQRMDRAPVVWIDLPREIRLHRILEEYGSLSSEWLIKCTKKLQKRLGGERTQHVVSLIQSQHLREAASILLDYYDSAYAYSRSRHSRPLFTIDVTCFQNLTDEVLRTAREIMCSPACSEHF